ncbi:MAG: hypothetical protein KBD83_05395 [Gammaproteobacteria bacterium]|nr:hypothetical protein [Gammaproteobacteria bacterium]
MMNENKFTAWMKEQYSYEQLVNIALHGCEGGVCGLCYYSETTAIYASFKDEIWEILQKRSEDYDCNNVIEMLASNSEADFSESYTFENHLVWFAVRDVAYQLTQGEPQQEEVPAQEEAVKLLGEDEQYEEKRVMQRHSLSKGVACRYMVYTCGVFDWAKTHRAHWLIDLITLKLLPILMQKAQDRFYSLKIKINNRKGVIIVTDGNSEESILEENLSYADFSEAIDLTFFLVSTNNEDTQYCLMFPNEY